MTKILALKFNIALNYYLMKYTWFVVIKINFFTLVPNRNILGANVFYVVNGIDPEELNERNIFHEIFDTLCNFPRLILLNHNQLKTQLEFLEIKCCSERIKHRSCCYSKSSKLTLEISLALDKEITFKTVFRYRHIYPMAIDAIASGKTNNFHRIYKKWSN